MSTRTNALSSLVTRFARTGSGIAAVEFALIVPIMLLLYLGAVDLTQGLMADRKLNHLTGTLGDLVAQDDLAEVTGAEIEGYFEASTALMRPYDAESTGMRVTIATVDSGTAEVVASVAGNGMTAYEAGDEITLTTEIANLAEGLCVVISDGAYAYAPMFRYVFESSVGLEQRSINLPRGGSEGCGTSVAICAGFSGIFVQGLNCNDANNSWPTLAENPGSPSGPSAPGGSGGSGGSGSSGDSDSSGGSGGWGGWGGWGNWGWGGWG